MHASTFIPDSNVGWPNVLSPLRWANVGPTYIAAWDPIANNQSKVLYVVGAISYAGRRHTLQWRHNERSGVSNHQPHDCLLNHLFRRRSKKTSTLRVTGLCAGNSPVTGEFPAQRTSNEQNVSIWWRHHEIYMQCALFHWDRIPTKLDPLKIQCKGMSASSKLVSQLTHDAMKTSSLRQNDVVLA